jgi:Pyruvate kinase
MLRRTKILATLGPATDKPGVLEAMFAAGLDFVRMNFSHGSAQDHINRANAVRELSLKLADWLVFWLIYKAQNSHCPLQRHQSVLKEGQDFALDINFDPMAGDNTQVGITYEPLALEVKPGSRLLLDDGRIVLDVVNVENMRVNCTVIVGGDLSNNKGINLLGGGLSAAALTDKDKEDIKTIAIMKCDYVAISFPRSAEDLHEARRLLVAEGCHAGIVSKVERAEALDVIDEIILASDAVMVARGDLGVEIGDANLPAVQKNVD